MANAMRVIIEIGPKGKRVVAVSPDWPGLSRGAKTEDAALERIRAYLPRYAPIAALAGRADEFAAIDEIEVTERYPGTGSTDFWGISFAPSAIDKQTMAPQELERQLGLMRSAWRFFDQTYARVSPILAKGPRGGGKDRDQIFRHTVITEMEWGTGLGGPKPTGETPTPEQLAAHRDMYCAGIRERNADGRLSGKWPLRFMIRHTAFHTLDHAWEMEDKDLTNAPAATD